MNTNDYSRSNNNSNNVILHGHCRFLQARHESTYNALQNHIIVLSVETYIIKCKTSKNTDFVLKVC